MAAFVYERLTTVTDTRGNSIDGNTTEHFHPHSFLYLSKTLFPAHVRHSPTPSDTQVPKDKRWKFQLGSRLVFVAQRY